MRTRLLTCIALLSVVAFTADEGHAWCHDPTATWTVTPVTFSGEYYYVCKGELLTFDGNDSKDRDCSSCSGADYCDDGIGLWKGIQKYTWNIAGSTYVDNWSTHGIRTHTFTSRGQKTVKLTVLDNDDADYPCCCELDPDCENDDAEAELQQYVRVVEVKEIVKNEYPYTNTGPLYVCLNSSVGLRVKAYDDYTVFPPGRPIWEVNSCPTGASPTLNPTTGSTTTTLSGLTKAGNYKIKAKCCDSCGGNEDIIDVNVIEVSSVTATNSADLCTNITFTVSINPSGNYDLIQWTASCGAEPDSGSGTSTFTTKWSWPGSESATASCSASEQTKYVTIQLPSGCSNCSGDPVISLAETEVQTTSSPDCGEGDCGRGWVHNITATVTTPCYSNGKWRFGATATADFIYGPCTSYFTDITDGYDSDLNGSNYCEIFDAFNYGTSGIGNGCTIVGDTLYSNTICVWFHEYQHYWDFHNRLPDRVVQLRQHSAFSDMYIDCSDSNTTSCSAAKSAREDAIKEAVQGAYIAAAACDEDAAEETAAPCFQEVADSIYDVWGDCD